MRHPLFLAVLALAAACGPSVELRQVPSNRPWVQLSSYDLEPGDVVSAGGVTSTVGDDNFDFNLNVPADSLGVGEHTLSVTVDRNGSVATRQVSVEVRPGQLEPYLRIGPCPMGPSKSEAALPVKIAGDVFVDTASVDTVADKPVRCSLDQDTSLRVMANPGATVTIGGQDVQLENGFGTWSLDRGALMRALTLKQLQGRGEVEVEIPAVLTRPGADPEQHVVKVTLNGFALQLALVDGLRAVTPGKPVPYPRSEHDGSPRGLILTSQLVKAKVGGEEKEEQPRFYSGLRAVGPSELTADAVDLFAVATPTDVTPGGSCRFNMGSGVGVVGNRIVKFGLDIVVVDASGKEVARRAFPTATKATCPDAIAGKQGETVMITSGPESAEVYGWLEQVRSGTNTP